MMAPATGCRCTRRTARGSRSSRIERVSPRSGRWPPDGSDLRNLTNHPQHFDGQWSVAWSPDGSRLAYGPASFPDAGRPAGCSRTSPRRRRCSSASPCRSWRCSSWRSARRSGSFTIALAIVVACRAMPRIVAVPARCVRGGAHRGRSRPLACDCALADAGRRCRAAGGANLAIGLTIGPAARWRGR